MLRAKAKKAKAYIMTRPTPSYVERIKAMIRGETFVLQGETSASAVRYHVRRINPDMRVSLWRGVVRVQFKPDLTPEQAEKAAEKALNARERLSEKSKPYIKKRDRNPAIEPDEAPFVESVVVRVEDEVYIETGEYQP